MAISTKKLVPRRVLKDFAVYIIWFHALSFFFAITPDVIDIQHIPVIASQGPINRQPPALRIATLAPQFNNGFVP